MVNYMWTFNLVAKKCTLEHCWLFENMFKKLSLLLYADLVVLAVSFLDQIYVVGLMWINLLMNYYVINDSICLDMRM